MQFDDSIENNLGIIKDLLSGIPPAHRQKARRAATELENAFTRLRKDNPRDPAVALGAAFAVFMLAQRLVQVGQAGDSEKSNLIHLLS